ncbi:hypothetical protein QMG83_04380 [Salinibacterium sp. G-O1]|uniref:hypothetical protein n=1 Tax=Salinibacterium sp. G-O1 TaxID=3046208 RepID=UPI0024BAB5B5|nr:hypothetical protein [Salinibacterium sp. G-O1]MDJ0334454.1 hypothetical protein [Salinibacterium sp. G-O1]
MLTGAGRRPAADQTVAPWYRAPRHWGIFWIAFAASSGVAIGLTAAIEAFPVLKLAIRDVAAVARDGLPLPFFTGWISNIGIVGWFVSAAALLVAAQVGAGSRHWRSVVFTGAVASLSFLLGVDDLFMIHDGAITFGEEWLLLLWFSLAIAWVIMFRRELLHDPLLPVLVLCAAFFGHAVVADIVANGSLLLHEDASKLAAIVLWTGWALATTQRVIESSTRLRQRGPAAT